MRQLQQVFLPAPSLLDSHTRCRCPAVQDALKANPEAESMLYQVYFRYAGFRPMPKSACSCPGRPSIDDYAATLDTESLKAGFDDAMTAVMGGKSSSAAAAASPSPSGPSSSRLETPMVNRTKATDSPPSTPR